MKPPVYDPGWPADIQALYSHDVAEIWDRSIAPNIWNQYHNQLEIYCSFAPGGRALDVLDVGCAQGTLALVLAERGHNVCAMDIRQQFLGYAASRHEHGNVRFVCGNVMETSPGGQFDLIFANQIVEHLVYPAELVGRLAGWLKAGGRLVMTTPNGDYVKNSLPAFGEIGDPAGHVHSQFSADADGHFFAYRPTELASIFAKAGLPDCRIEFFETPWISGHMKVRYLHRFAPVGILRLLDRLTLRVPRLGRRLAHQLMAIGEKPA